MEQLQLKQGREGGKNSLFTTAQIVVCMYRTRINIGGSGFEQFNSCLLGRTWRSRGACFKTFHVHFLVTADPKLGHSKIFWIEFNHQKGLSNQIKAWNGPSWFLSGRYTCPKMFQKYDSAYCSISLVLTGEWINFNFRGTQYNNAPML